MVRIQKRTARNNNIRRYKKSVHRGGTWMSTVQNFGSRGLSAASGYITSNPELSAATATAQAKFEKVRDTAQGAFDDTKSELSGVMKKTVINVIANQLVTLCGQLSGGLVNLSKAVESNKQQITDEATKAYDDAKNEFNVMLYAFCSSFMLTFGEVVSQVRTALTANLDDETRKLFNKSLGTIAKEVMQTIGQENQLTFFVVISLLSDLMNPRENRKLLDNATINQHFDSLTALTNGGGRSSRRY
jgi:hypothetical protein